MRGEGKRGGSEERVAMKSVALDLDPSGTIFQWL